MRVGAAARRARGQGLGHQRCEGGGHPPDGRRVEDRLHVGLAVLAGEQAGQVVSLGRSAAALAGCHDQAGALLLAERGPGGPGPSGAGDRTVELSRRGRRRLEHHLARPRRVRDAIRPSSPRTTSPSINRPIPLVTGSACVVMAPPGRTRRSLTIVSPSRGNRRRPPAGATLLPDPEPRPIRVPVISVDDHLIEPPDLFEGRLPAGLQDAAPRVSEHEDGTQAWVFEGRTYPNVGLNAVVGRPTRSGAWTRPASTRCGPAASTSTPAIADMDLDGVWASLCFPSLVAGFCGAVFSRAEDPELGLACLRAWNDWHLEVWAGHAPRADHPAPAAVVGRRRGGGGRTPRQRRPGVQGGELPRVPGPARAALHLLRGVGPLLRRLRGDGHRGLPRTPGLVLGPAAVARPALRTAAHPLPGQRPRWPRASGCGPACRCASPGSVALSEGGIGWVPDAHRPGRLRPRATRRRAPRAPPGPPSCCRARCCGATSGSAPSTTRRSSSCATGSASTTSWWRATTPTPTPPGPTPSACWQQTWGISPTTSCAPWPAATPRRCSATRCPPATTGADAAT